ncbi:DUF6415 family natural product biosynthesis protein [Streptomyces chrestomyceticus]|uniref:DUF6415 family natural product biosynthesis protein n=1 Tax=Streptomyces chrestomyceticus TaxID=68185 RepID=UPI0035A88866
MDPQHILYDPEGLWEQALPLDREPYLSLVTAVLAWTGPEPVLQPRDDEQINLHLTGHARAVAGDVQRRCAALPKGSRARALAEAALGEAERRLAAQPDATVAGVQNRARLLRALYEHLDHLKAAERSAPATTAP